MMKELFDKKNQMGCQCAGDSLRNDPPISLSELSIPELDLELIARGVNINPEKRFLFPDGDDMPHRTEIMNRIKSVYHNPPKKDPDPQLRHIDTPLLITVLKKRIELEKQIRGIHGDDDRKDVYEVSCRHVHRNIQAVAAICFQKDAPEHQAEYCSLRVNHFGKSFNMCENERFYDQPVAAGFMITGFLIEQDAIATAGHAINPATWEDLRIIFGYCVNVWGEAGIRIPKQNIYTPVKLESLRYSRGIKGDDWAVLRLDRPVTDRKPVNPNLSPLSEEQKVYILGFPLGLPLKYATGVSVKAQSDYCFFSDLDVYSSNSGSPVFDAVTHKVIGMVVKGSSKDFRWTGSCWTSIMYANEYLEKEAPGAISFSKILSDRATGSF